MEGSNRAVRLVQLGITAVVLLLLGAIVFRDFIFGEKVLLYKNIGDDSTNFYYPYLLLFSRYWRTDGIPMWSFHVGLGQNIFSGIGDFLFQPSIWFSPSAIAKLLVYQHLFHVLVAGLLFYWCLSLRGVNFCASLLGSLLFTFSAFMCMGSCWLIFGNEVICIAFVLFGVELALRRGRWLALAFAVALFALISAFHVYLCAILLGGYAMARLWVASVKDTSTSRARRLTQFAFVGILGVGLVTVVWLDSAQAIYHSPRGSGPESYAGKLISAGPFHFESPLHYFTAIFRSFSNDMMGTGDGFRGWSNYLEAPSSYAGLLPLLMLPQAFVGARKRRRAVYALLLTAILLTIAFPWLRHLFWLFQGDYYRTLSFFSITAVILLSMKAFSRYFEKGILNLWLLWGTLIALLGLLFLPLPAMQSLADVFLQHIVAALLVSYALLLSLGRWLKREPLFSWLLVLLSCAELTHFSWITVSHAPTVTKEELHARVGYNDHTWEALRDIKASDPGFYRIGKIFSSSLAEHATLNDAVVFDFYGTSSYHSFNSVDYTRFFVALEAIPPTTDELGTRWSYGSLGRPILSTFLCEKYLISNEPFALQEELGFEEVGQYGNIHAYRNPSFLPFGLFFEKPAGEKTFRQLSDRGKESLLLQAVVLADEGTEFAATAPPELNEVLDAIETTPIQSLIARRRESAFRLGHFSQNQIDGTITCIDNGFLVFQMTFDDGWRVTVDGTRIKPRRVDIGLLGFPLTIGEHTVSLRYLPPLLPVGLAITGASALVLLIARWRWPRVTPLT
ncbi:MAG: YfhO family protein [Chthoniobacterales bacterium]